MTRYYFHVEDGVSYPDTDGTELPDIDAARIQAVQMFGTLLVDSPASFWNGDEWTLTCTDDARMTMFTVQFVATDAPAAPRRKIEPPKLPLSRT